MNRVAVIAIVISGLSSFHVMQVLGQRSQSSDSEIPKLVQQSDEIGELNLRWIEEALSSGKFADRQRAMWLLGENPEKTASLVRQAKQSFVPEVVARAEWIERVWQGGILFGDEYGGLRNGMTTSRLGSLLGQGRFDAVLFALGVAQDGEASSRLRKKVAGLISVRFAVLAQLAVESQQVSKLVEILDLVAESRELALCRLQLLQWMEADLDVQGLLPKAAKGWTPSQRDEITVLLLYQLGEIEAAITRAKNLENKQLHHSCLILASRWNELADDAMTIVKDSEVGSESYVKGWSKILIAADRSGDQSLIRKATEKLSTPVFDESNKVRGIRWKTLAMHGQLDTALAILDQQSPASSTEVALAASRPERTFGLLGHPVELVDSKYLEWVDQALESQKILQKSQGLNRGSMCDEVDKLVMLINCLNAVGRDDVGFLIAKRLCENWRFGKEREIKEYLLNRISPVIRRQWVEQVVLFGNPTQLQMNDERWLADSIGDCDIATLSLLHDSVQQVYKSAALSKQLSVVCQIARGNTAAGVNVDQVLELMMDSIFRRLDVIQPKTGTPVFFMDNIYGLLLKHGKYQIAAAYLRRFAERGQVNAMLRLAEAELSTGSMVEAKGWFEKIETLAARKSATIEDPKFGSVGDLDAATVKTLIGRWVSARRIGDQALANSLRNKLEVVLCSPSFRFRMAIADYLREHGETDLATEVYKGMLPLAALTVDSTQATYAGLILYDVIRKYVLTIEKEQPSEAARLFDVAVIDMVDSERYRATAYVSLPLMIQEWRLEAGIREKDRETVARSLKRILQLDPLDISFSEEQLPLMRMAGMEQLADTVLDQILDAGVDYAERFSCDAMTCNNVAWVAAKNKRRLNDALKLATLAVRVEPESTTYRDTLAEILFLLGRTKEALQIEQACLLDDPGQWHLHEQIKKFAKGVEEDQP